MSHGSIEYFTKLSCDNIYCVWLYSLIFVVPVKGRLRAFGDGAHLVHGHGSHATKCRDLPNCFGEHQHQHPHPHPLQAQYGIIPIIALHVYTYAVQRSNDIPTTTPGRLLNTALAAQSVAKRNVLTSPRPAYPHHLLRIHHHRRLHWPKKRYAPRDSVSSWKLKRQFSTG